MHFKERAKRNMVARFNISGEKKTESRENSGICNNPNSMIVDKN